MESDHEAPPTLGRRCGGCLIGALWLLTGGSEHLVESSRFQIFLAVSGDTFFAHIRVRVCFLRREEEKWVPEPGRRKRGVSALHTKGQ